MKNNITSAKHITPSPDFMPANNNTYMSACLCRTGKNPDQMDDDDFERLLNDFIASEKNDLDAGTAANDSSFCSDTAAESHPTATEDATPAYSDGNASAAQRLQAMIGLKKVKQEIEEARTMAMFLNERKKLGLEKNGENRNHMIFSGSPGTGKTTVAKLIGEMYHDMGLLSAGHIVETNRAGLLGEFIGQTEKNTKEAIERARGGVLFIDEAYTLIRSKENTNDFGIEVINTLLTVLSEPEPDMIVILAGYDDKMEQLLKANPGLNDRFPIKIHFDDYSADELMEIARRSLCTRNLTLSADADAALFKLMEKAVTTRDCHFGNGRWVANLIDHGIVKSMAARVMANPHHADTRTLFSLIEKTDIDEAAKSIPEKRQVRIDLPRRIGFSA